MNNVSVMIKPASSLCNLRCKYCFYCDVASGREDYSFGVMKEEVSEKLILSLLDYADGGSIYIVFQGGEPLMAGLPYFRHFVEFFYANNSKKSPVTFSLQTNGTLLNNEWVAFFKQHKFLIGLSLDGNENTNKFRVNQSGENSFSSIISASKKLAKKGVEFNVLAVLTGYMADNCTEVYNFFREKGFGYIQFIPCLRPFEGADESELYMTSEQFEHFLVETFKLYVRDYAAGNYVSIRYFDNIVRLFRGGQPEQCGLGGFCSRQFVVEGNGNVYPCDFYCSDEWLLGNVMQDDFSVIASCEKAKTFVDDSMNFPEKCKACRYAYLCRAGGCKRQRRDHDYCIAYKNFFSFAEELLKRYF